MIFLSIHLERQKGILRRLKSNLKRSDSHCAIQEVFTKDLFSTYKITDNFDIYDKTKFWSAIRAYPLFGYVFNQSTRSTSWQLTLASDRRNHLAGITIPINSPFQFFSYSASFTCGLWSCAIQPPCSCSVATMSVDTWRSTSHSSKNVSFINERSVFCKGKKSQIQRIFSQFSLCMSWMAGKSSMNFLTSYILPVDSRIFRDDLC